MKADTRVRYLPNREPTFGTVVYLKGGMASVRWDDGFEDDPDDLYEVDTLEAIQADAERAADLKGA